ncbi:YncE family protein [Botrimarina mediterranea]|uniref:YncE family protein n=1 Tax=Botrimarina mediterranea TaxID=2528022 RepID=UPI00118D0FE3|nr:hypothetical protein K2D_10280 [Planctomycetes bacterium K2D]
MHSPRSLSVLAVASVFALLSILQCNAYALSGNGRYLLKVDETLLNTGSHDLDFDGSTWYVAQTLTGAWSTYDASFGFLSETSISGVGDLRGLAYSSALNQLVVLDQDTGIVRFVNPDGAVTGRIRTGAPATEGMDIDDRDSTLWLTRFEGSVEKWSFSGELLFSFDARSLLPTNDELQSVAVDPDTNGLFVFTNSDDLFEFSMDGTLRGQLLTDAFPSSLPGVRDNGLGIHYDAPSKTLRLTSQGGDLYTYALIPEPSSVALALLTLVSLARFRR